MFDGHQSVGIIYYTGTCTYNLALDVRTELSWLMSQHEFRTLITMYQNQSEARDP